MKRSALFCLAAMLLAWPSASRAEVIINIYQIGTDVFASGSGTLDTTDLTIGSTGTADAGIAGKFAAVRLGPASNTDTYQMDTTTSGPTNFGSGNLFNPDIGTGNVFGVNGAGHVLYTPAGYLSGTGLSSLDTYHNASISSLGLTPGTYTFTWGTGLHADSLVVNIVPEPGSLTLVISAAAIGLGARSWSRRRAARA